MLGLLKFTLDLFEGQSPSSSPPPRRLPKKPFFKPNSPPAQLKPAAPAIENIADLSRSQPAQPLQTLQEALAPHTFAHPAATRQLLLGNLLVGYEFKRGKRRTIGFSVGPSGLSVKAPKWTPLYEVDKAVLAKADWIVAKLTEARGAAQRRDAKRIEFKDGAELMFLGQPMRLVLDAAHGFASAGGELKSLEVDGSPARLELHISLPHSATEAQVKDAAQAWLMRQAKRIFTERLNHFAPQLGVQYKKLSLSSANTRWGSASADGSIRLNWYLAHFSMSVIDYVVVHELAHLRVMDHSPRFWDTVATVMPDYAQRRGLLKGEGVPGW
jgi:predicted metal-dependent hydrolase